MNDFLNKRIILISGSVLLLREPSYKEVLLDLREEDFIIRQGIDSTSIQAHRVRGRLCANG